MALASADERKPVRSSKYHLDPNDKEICQRLIIIGESVFDDLQWDKEKRREFLSRMGIKRELERLRNLWNDRNAIQDRVAFFASVEIQKMVPAAIAILARRLRGEINQRTNQRYPDYPTDDQYAAALEVLNRAGVEKMEISDDVGVPLIDARTVNVGAEALEARNLDATASRERIRNAISVVIHRLEKSIGSKMKIGKHGVSQDAHEGEQSQEPSAE